VKSNSSRTFEWNGKEYEVESTPCYIEDALLILQSIVSQAIQDFIKYHQAKRNKKAEEIYQSAKTFLFDDDHRIDYGDMQLSLRDMLAYIAKESDINLTMIREDILRRATREFSDSISSEVI